MRIRGRAFVLERRHMDASASRGAETELNRFREAYSAIHEALALQAASDDIFAAHLEMLEDPMLSESIEEAVAEGLSAEAAVQRACAGICGMFSEIDDEYLKARVDDVKDVCRRLEGYLDGTGAVNPFRDLQPGTVIVAEELLPSDTSLMDFSLISGLVTAKGSTTSHVCIIARSKGVPALVGVDISGISTGDMLDLESNLMAGGEVMDAMKDIISGREVALYANAGSVDEVKAAVAAGAEGIGLFRTEFLFMSGDSLPSCEQQQAAYRDALEACDGRPLTIRTLDIGGDKALPYLPMDREDNPFLGLRGIRFCLSRPELLRTQFRAMVAAYRELCDGVKAPKLKIMIPMVDGLPELRECRRMLVEECSGTVPEGISLGIMIETPAAVFNAAELACECDFFSIGTNDLTQYVMAADRGNASVAYLYDVLSPAMRRAVSMAVEAAHDAGIPVGVCGEAASDPESAAVLVELGVDSLSINGLAN